MVFHVFLMNSFSIFEESNVCVNHNETFNQVFLLQTNHTILKLHILQNTAFNERQESQIFCKTNFLYKNTMRLLVQAKNVYIKKWNNLFNNFFNVDIMN